MPNLSLGIDIGGTFTDIVFYDHDSGRQYSRKILTTHQNPAAAVIEGTQDLIRKNGINPRDVRRAIHATTLFTNALIERKGALTGLITTLGFRDVLEIGRERKYDLYDIGIVNPAPLVPRNLRREVSERLRADGSVLTKLDEAGLLREVDYLVSQDVKSVAVVFLHSYANAGHEDLAAELILRRAPGMYVTTSHEVASEIREFDRTSTTVANAYVKPLAGIYIDEISRGLLELGVAAPLLLMLSNGGLTHAEEAKRVPVQMLESGPAAGALAAGHFGLADGEKMLLAFDMGGTTAKLSIVENGQPMIAYSFEAARQRRFIEGSGLPIRISTVELIEIGAGGGSIARKDEIGLLKVGPDSAGSEPGPVCYGRGGTAPTVTDANFDLGTIHASTFAGGTVPVDLKASGAALKLLGEDLDLDQVKVASGIYDIVNENMAAAARVHISERGRDPVSYALLCTGGGGPVHGYQVARKLGIKRMICPPEAGVASAVGLIIAPMRADRVATVGFRLATHDIARLEASFVAIQNAATEMLTVAGVKREDVVIHRFADGRFVGQGFDLVVPLPPGPYDSSDSGIRNSLLKAFEVSYQQKFSRTPPSVPVEFINIRVSARAAVASSTTHSAERSKSTSFASVRPVFFSDVGKYMDARVFRRTDLSVGDVHQGPAVIEEDGSTLVIGPAATFEVVPSYNIVVNIA
jgi:N-methylhydantoinase A